MVHPSHALLLGLLACTPPDADPLPPIAPPPAAPVLPDDGDIAYTVRLTAPQTHRFEVEASFPTGGEPLELMMATWTPGSYLIREYARHVEGVAAWVDGQPAEIAKTSKNRWTVQGAGERVTLRYRVFAHDLSVRTNFLDPDLALLNGAPTFLTPVGRHDQPRTVRLELPDGWTAATALDPHPEDPDRYVAPDYDTLVDSPIIAGELAEYPFDLDGTPHWLVNLGEAGVWDGERSARDVERLTRAQVTFWGGMPYRSYRYLNVLAEAGGGLEHKESTLMLGSRWATHQPDTYRRWLGLASHEMFHTWNGKRLRPHVLGPFDYEVEAVTPDLWVVEGLTSYYAPLLLVRAGLTDLDTYLEGLSRQIRDLQGTPGRLHHALTDTSRDAWIKYYRPDANSSNSTVSYYLKGAVVGFLLDAELRRRTGDRRSLDDAMRLAYARFSGERGYTREEFRSVLAEVAGEPMDDWLAHAVDGVGELDYRPALAWYGLRFAEAEEEADEVWAGLEVDGSNRIRRVFRDGPGEQAALALGDEIVGLGGFRVEPGGWAQALKRHEPGASVEVLVSRRGQLVQADLLLRPAGTESWTLELDPGASPQARRRLKAWLGG